MVLDIANNGKRGAMSESNLSWCDASLEVVADRASDGLVDDCLTMGAPAQIYAAAFGHHVGVVVEQCAKEQMSRVAAWRIVASMADAQVQWITVGHKPGKSMRQPMSRRYRSWLLAKIEATIATTLSGACPWPALTRPAPIDLAPETCDRLFIHGGSSSWVTPPDGSSRRGGNLFIAQGGLA